MMPCEIIKIVKGVLSEAEQVLGFLVLQRVGLDRNTEGEDGAASLCDG